MKTFSGRLVSATVVTMITGALGFGAVQVFATPAPASTSCVPSEPCCDLMTCVNGCMARYGDGAYGYCKGQQCVCVP